MEYGYLNVGRRLNQSSCLMHRSIASADRPSCRRHSVSFCLRESVRVLLYSISPSCANALDMRCRPSGVLMSIQPTVRR